MTEPASDGNFELPILPGAEKESFEGNKRLESFFYEVNLALGGDGIDIDLTDNDFRFCFNRSLGEFRGISTRSVFETIGFLELRPNVQSYHLHRAIDNVMGVMRQRALFGNNSTGFDYFSQVGAGMIYPGSQPGGYMGLATYDFALQYEETTNRLFARDIRFEYRNWDQTLFLYQVPHGTNELVILQCAVLKNIPELLSDHWSYLWLQKYTTAMAKSILANKWGKFPQLPGAQGGVQFNAQKLAEEANNEIKELREQVFRFEDGGTPAYPMMM
jgi:hypothetical protein